MTVRYAVVGTGRISQIAFLPGIAQLANSRVTALVTGNAARAEKLARLYGIKNIYSYAQYDQMLSGNVADAVYIALPNSMHADYTIRAAQAGKHILVEKPLAVSIAECKAMISAARASGVFLMTAYRLHNEPANLHALKLIYDGAIGDPRAFISIFSFMAGPDNHRLQASHWGGPLQDIGVYCLNAARHAFRAEPVEVLAKRNAVKDRRFREVEECMAATLMFPEGRVAQFIASFGAEQLDMFRVAGTKGEIAVENAYDFPRPTTVRLTCGDEIIEHHFAHTDQFAGQIAYFSDCILGNNPPEADGEEGMADVAILCAIEKAAQTGVSQRIDLKPRPRHPAQDMARFCAPKARHPMPEGKA